MKSILFTALLVTGLLAGAVKVSAQTDYAVRTNYIEGSLVAYPNPASSVVHVVLPESSPERVLVNVIDMGGMTVRSYKFPTGSYMLDIDMSMLPIGLYNISVYEPGNLIDNIKVVRS